MGGKYHNLRATLQSGQGSIFETISNLCFVHKNEEKAVDSCRFLRPEIMRLGNLGTSIQEAHQEIMKSNV